MTVQDTPNAGMTVQSEADLRIDLAAAFRLTAAFGWHESVANHFSAAVSPDGRRFLMNPRWVHFSTIKASDLLLLDADDPSVMEGDNAPDPSGWSIHGAAHRENPAARVLLHVHPPHATALSTLKDPSIPPIDQNTARFYTDMAVDLGFDGIATDEAEGQRIAKAFGNHSVLMMGNHGVTCTGQTVAEAFETLYYLEKSCQTVLMAYSTGRELNVMSDEIATKTAEGWKTYAGQAEAHFDYLKSTLSPDFRD